MAKAKRRPSSSSSASRRREEVKKQRQSPGSQHKRYRQSNPNRRTQITVGVVLLVVAVAIGIFVYLSQQSSQQSANTPATPVSSSVFKAVTNVSPSISAAVGSGGQQKMLTALKGAPFLKGPGGKPEFFYAGGEFCPFCAAQRWAMVVALSRFGSLSHLGQIQSSEDNISTFTFYHSSYSSQYIDFVPVELDGMVQGQALQVPTSDQQKLIDTYDAPPYLASAGSIPFTDIANQQVMQGANYSPQVLSGLTWDQIANDLSNQNSDVTKGIVGSANYLTAAICKATNQQPSSVCTAAPIPQIEQSLAQTRSQLNLLTDAVLRRQE